MPSAMVAQGSVNDRHIRTLCAAPYSSQQNYQRMPSFNETPNDLGIKSPTPPCRQGDGPKGGAHIAQSTRMPLTQLAPRLMQAAGAGEGTHLTGHRPECHEKRMLRRPLRAPPPLAQPDHPGASSPAGCCA